MEINRAERGGDVATFGQIFTPQAVVEAMLNLRQHRRRTLEPSCGQGAFSAHIDDCVAIEIDPRHAPPASINIDFFAYPTTEKFHTVIGNPPFVRHRDIHPATCKLLTSHLFDKRANLYLFFIEKAIHHLVDHGELIFITPHSFLKSTSALALNRWLYHMGTITHIIHLGDCRIFSSAMPNCTIWRFEKSATNRSVLYAEIPRQKLTQALLMSPPWQTRLFVEQQGQLIFAPSAFYIPFKSIAHVKVGAVSGADAIFANARYGNRDFVYSATRKSGKTRKMLWVDAQSAPNDYLRAHKNTLINRKIRPFHENNWWHWGRGYPQTLAPRIYVNQKTRHPRPFFIHPCRQFDGSILAIFPHQGDVALQALCDELNNTDWNKLGFVCDGRFMFSQRSLENVCLPENFARYKIESLGAINDDL